MIQNLQSLIGYFDLDPNRVLDLVLEALEAVPSRVNNKALVSLFNPQFHPPHGRLQVLPVRSARRSGAARVVVQHVRAAALAGRHQPVAGAPPPLAKHSSRCRTWTRSASRPRPPRDARRHAARRRRVGRRRPLRRRRGRWSAEQARDDGLARRRARARLAHGLRQVAHAGLRQVIAHANRRLRQGSGGAAAESAALVAAQAVR